MARALIDDCFRPTDGDRQFSHDEVIATLRDRLAPTVSTKCLRLAELTGRILAEPIIASFDVPPAANAAVDGYAFAHDMLEGGGAMVPMRVVGVAAAGHPFAGDVPSGAAVRILTGAVVPDGCDTVVMQEDCDADAQAERVSVPVGVKKGANIRPAGEDVTSGTEVFRPGHRIRQPDLAALASIGVGEATCYRRPRVALFSTGDELVRPGAGRLGPGEVYDANCAMLCAMIDATGGTCDDRGILDDDASAVRNALEAAARGAHRVNLVVTSGGASQGSEDYIAGALAELGTRHTWRINIKPGRPIMFGQIGDTVCVGLPGNPVAAFVCFALYVRPIIAVLGGAPWPEPGRLKLPAGFSVRGRKVGRREYWRAWTETDRDGRVIAQKFPRDGSGLISGLRAATGLIEVPEAAGDVAPGDLVTFIPFSEFDVPARPMPPHS